MLKLIGRRYRRLILFLFNFYRLSPSLLTKLLIFYSKKVFCVKTKREDYALVEYFSALILINGRNTKESPRELISQMPSGINIITRKYPSSDLEVVYQVWGDKQYQPVV